MRDVELCGTPKLTLRAMPGRTPSFRGGRREGDGGKGSCPGYSSSQACVWVGGYGGKGGEGRGGKGRQE